MGRGYIYNVEPSESVEALGMDEEMFYEHLEVLGADYVKEEDGEYSAALASEFLKSMSGICKTGENQDGYWFVPDEQSAMQYFNRRLECLKNMVAKLTLQEFCEDSMILYHIRHLIENTYSDCVYTGGMIYTLDRFVRDMQPGKKYHLNKEKVILMH